MWKQHFKNHPDRKSYEKNARGVTKLITEKETPLNNFRSLERNKGLVTITRHPVTANIQALHHFGTIGTELIPDQMKFFALLGFGDQAIPVKLDIDQLFDVCPKKPVPSFESLVLTETFEKLIDLKPVRKWKSQKIPTSATLIPSLSDLLHEDPGMPIEEVFLKFTKEIRTLNLEHQLEIESEEKETNEQDDSEAEEDPIETEDSEEMKTSNSKMDDANEEDKKLPSFKDPNGEFEECFSSILIFLWAGIHYSKEKDVTGAVITPSFHQDAVNWSENLHFMHLRKEGQGNDKKKIENLTFPQDDFNGVASALVQCSTVMNKNIEIQVANQKEKQKKEKLKAFDSLSTTSKKVILTASAFENNGDDFDDEEDEDQVIPKMPTEELMLYINCTTFGRIKQEIQIAMDRHKIDIDRGLCTNIKNGLLLSQPSIRHVNHLSVAFVGPPTDEHMETTLEEQKGDSRTEELARNGKLTSTEVDKAVKQVIKWPSNYHELKHFAKNWATLNRLMFGTRSIVAKKTLHIFRHVTDREDDYIYAFKQNGDSFGKYWIYKNHVSYQTFLHSCAYGDVTLVKFEALDQKRFIAQIEEGEVLVRLPDWLKNLGNEDKKRTVNHQDSEDRDNEK